MKKIVNPANHVEQSLNPCNEASPLQADVNSDFIPEPCEDQGETLKDPGGEQYSWLEEQCDENSGLGHTGLCDPMQKGHIVNDTTQPNHDKDASSTLYRYSKSIRACDEAMLDMFRDLVVIDNDGKAYPVPIIWGTQERAVAVILQKQVRQDNSLVVDRPMLPMMAIHQTGTKFNRERYIYHKAVNYLRQKYDGDGPEYELPKPGFTNSEVYDRDTVFGVARGIPVDISYNLICWTLYVEDMNQILEQVYTKFSPIAYINIRGINWEVGVRLDSEGNNLDTEPGEKLRVIKYEFGMTAETFVSQPIVRKKAVLKQRINLVEEGVEDEYAALIDKLEVAVKELE